MYTLEVAAKHSGEVVIFVSNTLFLFLIMLRVEARKERGEDHRRADWGESLQAGSRACSSGG